MGCSTSSLGDEDAVQLCKDRRKYIKQAVEYRGQFAAGHVAYIQSLRRVSSALRRYVEGDECCEFLTAGSYATPSFAPVKKVGPPEFVTIPLKSCSSATPIHSHTGSSRTVHYSMRSSVSRSVSVEERPRSPATVRIESYYPMHHYGTDGYIAMQPPYTATSFFSSSPYNRPSIPPPSPQTSQWDFFWNPFSSLDSYGYPTRSSVDQSIVNDEMTRLRQVREEEGIPDLEEEEEEEHNEERGKVDLNWGHEEAVQVEDDDAETDSDTEAEEHETREFRSQTGAKVGVSEARNAGGAQVSVANKKEQVCEEREAAEDAPGFTVFVNPRPMSILEVIKDLETQFMLICDSAKEVSTLLESSRVHYSSSSASELSAIKMLNPIALIRSASSRSASSRFLHAPSSSKDYSYDSGSDVSEDSYTFHGSHQSTLDRLYAWEKKLYEEVKSGEHIRIAYEKKLIKLRKQDMKGEDPCAVGKTRASVRDLHTRIKVSIHTIQSISKRIETLRDEELQPQLMELIQGLARMWRVKAECHRSQKRTIDEAKRLLSGTPPKLRRTSSSGADPIRLSQSASNLEAELRNWRACFESWIASQRSYLRALSSWALRCTRSRSEAGRRSDVSPPVFGICIQWSRFLDALHENPVVDDLDIFADGVRWVFARREEAAAKKKSKRFGVGFSPDTEGKMALVERERDEEEEEEEEDDEDKTAELAVKVLCAGMSVAVGSLMEFSLSSAEGYDDLVNRWASPADDEKEREERRGEKATPNKSTSPV